MISTFKQFVARQSFFYNRGQLYRLSDAGMAPCETEALSGALLPIVVVAKSHCPETQKTYPIADKKDLNEVLKAEFGGHALLEISKATDHSSSVSSWQLDDEAKKLSERYRLLWIPETWLISQMENTCLLKINRCGEPLWAAYWQAKCFTSYAKGLFSDADNVLLSIGADTSLSRKALSESEYAIQLREAILSLKPQRIKQVLPAQGFGRKFLQVANIPSLALGTVIGLLAFQLVQIGYYELRVHLLDGKIAEQNIGDVIRVQRENDAKLEVLQTLLASTQHTSIDEPLLLAITALMENQVTILRVSNDENGTQIRAQAKSSADALRLLSGLPQVASAEFSAPVRESRGDERFSVALTFKSDEVQG